MALDMLPALPVVSITGAPFAVQAISNGIPWRNLRSPSTNGGYIGVGGGEITLWDLKHNGGQSVLGNASWSTPSLPGLYDLSLGFSGQYSDAGCAWTAAEHGGTYSVGLSGVATAPHRFSAAPKAFRLAVDRYKPNYVAIWADDVAYTVNIYDMYDLSLFASINVSAQVNASNTVKQMAYHYPHLVLVLTDLTTFTDSIVSFDITNPAGSVIIETDMADVWCAANADTIVWSHALTVRRPLPPGRTIRNSELFYWIRGMPTGKRLFTPQRNFDMKYPRVAGDTLSFVQAWPVAVGQTRASRKTAILLYDLKGIGGADSRVSEIADTGIWSDDFPLHDVAADYGTGFGTVVFFSHPPVNPVVRIPHLYVRCFT
jgi:hypothetical protein